MQMQARRRLGSPRLVLFCGRCPARPRLAVEGCAKALPSMLKETLIKMGSYPVADLKGGLHRPPVAPLPIYEHHIKIMGGYPMATTQLGMFLICKLCSLYICVKTSCLLASCQARPFSILHT